MSDTEDDFPGGPTNLEFWSLTIPPNKTVEAKIADLPGLVEIVHVTGCALDENPHDGPHVLKVIPYDVTGKAKGEVALGTLVKGRTEQFALDFGVSSTTAFRHSGKSTVFLNGYLTRSYASDMDDDEYEMEDDSESEEDSEDDEAPQAIPVNGVKAGSFSDDESESDEGESDEGEEEEEEEEEEDEEEEDRQGDKYDRMLHAKSFGDAMAGSSSSSEGEEDEDDESDDPLDIDSDDEVANVEYDAAADGGPVAMDAETDSEEGEEEGEEEEEEDEEEEDEEEEGEESSEEEEEEESEEEEAPKPAAAKRPSQPMTPQPTAAKRQKGQDGSAKVPQSAPAKGPQAKTAAAAAGGDAQQFLQQLVSELRKEAKPLTLNQLSAKVKKPLGVEGKYKAFLVQHPDTFQLDGDKVSLK